MLHDWRANKTRENRLRVTEIALAVDLHKQSVPSDTIVNRVQGFRDSLNASGSSGSSGFAEAAMTAIGAAGGAGGMQYLATAVFKWPLPVQIGTRTGAALLGAYTFNSWYDGNDDATFHQLDMPLENVLREYVDLYRADPAFRETADRVITPRWHFSPNDDVDTILAGSPDFALHANVRSLLDSAERQELLRDVAVGQLNAIQEDIGDTVDRLAVLDDDVVSFIDATRARWVDARIRRRSALDVANAHATVGLAASLIGLRNADLGRQVTAVGGAVFGVHAGLKTFETAADLGANMTLATTALAGNFVGAALSLVGAFSDIPSPEMVLMEQMQQLSRQVDRLRTEMHERFDWVDAQLVTILDTVTYGFRDVQNRIDALESDIGIANARLLALAQGQRDIQDLIVTQADILRERLGDLIVAIMGCAYSPFPVTADETDRDRQNCITAFGSLVDRLHESQQDVGGSDQLVDMHFRQFAQLLGSAGGSGIGVNEVVGPDAWLYVAVLLEDYLSKRPDFAEEFRVEIAQVVGGELARRRSDLRRYMSAVREDVKRFQSTSGQSAIGLALQEAREHVANVRAAVSSIADEYYADEGLSGVRAVVGADGSVTPAVRFEDEVPAWRPLSEFYAESLPPRGRRDYPETVRLNQTDHPEYWWWYTGGEVPAWIKADPDAAGEGVTCNTGPMIYATVEGRPGGNEERLRNIALEFLTTDDVAPARLGMGDVGFCYTFHEVDSGRNNQTLLYQNYQVELKYDFSSYGGGCSGERLTVRLPVYHRAHNYQSFYSSAMSAVVRGWMTFTRGIEDVLTGRHLSDGCWNSYRERLEEKKGELSEHIRRGLKERTESASGSRRTVALGQAIRSWISIAFDLVSKEAKTVDDIVSGSVTLPDVDQMLQDVYPWEVPEQAERSIDRLEEVLRSREMRDVAEYGFGHRLLTDVQFAVLGDLEGSEGW